MSETAKRRRKRTVHDRLLAAQRSLLLDPHYTGSQVVAACRQALHDQGLLVRREGWQLKEYGGVHHVLVKCTFSCQDIATNSSEIASQELVCESHAEAVRYGLGAMWEDYLRDLLLLPVFPDHAARPPSNPVPFESPRSEVPSHDDLSWMSHVAPSSNKVVGVFGTSRVATGP